MSYQVGEINDLYDHNENAQREVTRPDRVIIITTNHLCFSGPFNCQCSQGTALENTGSLSVSTVIPTKNAFWGGGDISGLIKARGAGSSGAAVYENPGCNNK